MKAKTARYIVSLLVFLCLAVPANAATMMRQFGTGDGLYNTQARQLMQLSDGRVMVVVAGMLCIYDGGSWHNVEYDDSNSIAIESFANTAQMRDSRGRIWVRENHRLFAIDEHSGHLLPPTSLLKEAELAAPLSNLFIDTDGIAWLLDEQGTLWRYDWEHQATRAKTFTPQQAAQLCDWVKVGKHHIPVMTDGQPFRKAIPWDSASYIIMDANGLRLMDAATGRVRCTLLSDEVTAARRTADGRLWVAQPHALICFDKHFRILHHITAAESLHTRRPVNDRWVDVMEDEEGGVWASSFDSGVFYCHPGSKTVELVKPDEDAEGPLIHGLLARGNEILALSSAGLLRYDAAGCHFLPVPAACREADGFSLQADSNGDIWAATFDQGLYVLRPTTNGYDVVRHDWRNRSLTFCNEVGPGLMLACHSLNHLVLYRPETGEETDLTASNPELQGFRYIVCARRLSSQTPTSLTPDPSPKERGVYTYVVGSQNGLAVIGGLNSLTPTSANSTSVNKGNHAPLLGRGVGGEAGFGGEALMSSSLKCNDILCTPDGHVWVATQNGLYDYDSKTDSVRRYTTADGLPSNYVQTLTLDREGHLWAATFNHIVYMPTMTILGPADGVPEGCFLERAVCQTDDGTLWFGSSEGIVRVAPECVHFPEISLRPRLLRVEVTGGEQPLDISAVQPHALSFAHDENFLTFTVSALNYAHAGHTVYRYRLKGIDADWNTVSPSDDVLRLSYTFLPHGTYQLIVQAALPGQTWGEEMTWRIEVRPPWWLSWWAKCFYALCIIAVATWLIRRYALRTANRAVQKAISPASKEFLERATALVEQHIAEADYTVVRLGQDLAMERSTLYRHIQAAAGQSPTEFIRAIRLRRAAELLQSGRYSVTEVSERVGFNSTRQFSQHFKEAFGVLPSKYRSQC